LGTVSGGCVGLSFDFWGGCGIADCFRCAHFWGTVGIRDCVFLRLGLFPIIYYHFDQNRCLGLGLRIVRLSEKNKLIFLLGMPLFAGGLGIFAKNAKKGILSNYPQKGCFFVRFCSILSDFVTFCNFWGFGVAFLSDFVGFELKAKKALKRAF